MPSCLVYALVQSVTFMVDTIIAGRFLGTDAVASIALGMPIIGLMLSFTGMLLQGGFLKLLNAMGRNNMNDYHRIFSLALVATMIVDLIFIAICIFGTSGVMAIAGAGKASATAVAFGDLYIKSACFMILFFSLGTLFQLVIATYGYQTDRMIGSVICVVVNVITSVIFINILSEPYKIAGLGIGSAIGTLSQVIVSYVMMKKRHIKLKFVFPVPNKKNIIDIFDMLRRGLPSSIDNMLDSVSGSIVNRIILASFADGTGVLAIVTIVKTLYSIVKTVGRGTFYASEPLIGILKGGRDNEGIKRAFKVALKYGLIYAVGMAAIIILIKNPFLNFYNMSDNADAGIGVILIAISTVLLVVSFVLNAVYESTGHLMLSLLVSVVPDSVLYPMLIPVAASTVGISGIWVAMGFNFIPFFIIFYIVFMIITKKLVVPLDRLLVLDKNEDREMHTDVSIPSTAENVSFVSQQLQKFLTEKGVNERVAYKTALCTEEIAADYIEHRKTSSKSDRETYMDIKVFRDKDCLEIIIRNYDEPYNPLVFEKDVESFSKIGVSMVQNVSESITYVYAYHLNIVTMIIKG